jgi:hypothetical protein
MTAFVIGRVSLHRVGIAKHWIVGLAHRPGYPHGPRAPYELLYGFASPTRLKTFDVHKRFRPDSLYHLGAPFNKTVVGVVMSSSRFQRGSGTALQSGDRSSMGLLHCAA